MYILSIDVGWRHLASCILYFDETNICIIKEWTLTNVLEDADEADKPLDTLNPDTKTVKKVIRKKENVDLTKVETKETQEKKGKRKRKEISNTNINKISIENLIGQSKNKIDIFIEKSKTNLQKYVEEHNTKNERKEEARIFIELQPMGTFSKNIKTKILSHILQFSFMNYFKVQFINSKKKLKSVLQGTKVSYSKLKKMSVDHALHLLESEITLQENKEWISFFQTQKTKKDDLADCFLQGYYGYKE
jgi:hypothetical protein